MRGGFHGLQPPKSAANLATDIVDARGGASAVVHARAFPFRAAGGASKRGGSWIWASGSPLGHGLAASRGRPLKFGEGCGAPGQARKLLKKYRFDQDRRSARSLSGSVRRWILFGPRRSRAPDGRAGLAEPGPGTPASPQACRPLRPFVNAVSVKRARPAPDDEVAAPDGTAADERFPLDRPPRPRRSQASRPPHRLKVRSG